MSMLNTPRVEEQLWHQSPCHTPRRIGTPASHGLPKPHANEPWHWCEKGLKKNVRERERGNPSGLKVQAMTKRDGCASVALTLRCGLQTLQSPAVQRLGKLHVNTPVWHRKATSCPSTSMLCFAYTTIPRPNKIKHTVHTSKIPGVALQPGGAQQGQIKPIIAATAIEANPNRQRALSRGLREEAPDKR